VPVFITAHSAPLYAAPAQLGPFNCAAQYRAAATLEKVRPLQLAASLISPSAFTPRFNGFEFDPVTVRLFNVEDLDVELPDYFTRPF
jgi:hypothetical protein